jgi:hypothetical protein
MRRSGVAGQALDLALECRRIRFQVSPMARGRRNCLPGFLRGPGDVAALAGGPRNLGVGRNLFTADAGHPQDQLHRFLDGLELVAGVAAEGIVLTLQLGNQGVVPGVRLFPGLPARDEDVTTGAEPAVSLHEVITLEAEAYREQDDEANDAQHRHLESPAPGPEPAENLLTPGPEPAQDEPCDYCGKHHSAPHDPGRSLENPLDDGNDGVGQERLVHDGVDSRAVDRAQ